MRRLTAKQVMTTEVWAVDAAWSIERSCEFLTVKSINGRSKELEKLTSRPAEAVYTQGFDVKLAVGFG